MNESVSEILTTVTSLADLTSLPDMDIFCMQLVKDSETEMHPREIAHSDNVEKLSELLNSILDSQNLPESSFVFINSGDSILKNLPQTVIGF